MHRAINLFRIPVNIHNAKPFFIIKSVGLATIYVLGMSVTYSMLGVLAAVTGDLLGAALQNPLVLVFVALVMVALALSMFGFYEFAIPSFITNKISGKQGFGGAHPRCAAMPAKELARFT